MGEWSKHGCDLFEPIIISILPFLRRFFRGLKLSYSYHEKKYASIAFSGAYLLLFKKFF